MISSLIDPNTIWWKAKVLHATFLPFEVDTILRIPLSYNLPEDKLLWIGNRKDEFLVKSAYHVAHSMVDASEEGESSSRDPYRQLWQNLWHLNLPAKIKIFAWRACVNGLPTYDNISKRGINCSTACPVYGLEPEDINHALLHCEVASLVWSLWPDYSRPPQGHHWSFLDMALHLNYSNASQALDLFFVLSWAIWSNRNKLVHNDSPLSPPQVWTLANNSLEDFKNAAASLDILPPRRSQNRWKAPPQGVFKVNVDGATSNQGRNSSIGVIIRDCFGHVVAALSKYLPGRFTVDGVKALAMEQGILLARELHLPRVILESDALTVIQALNDNSTGSELGHILQGIQLVCESFEFCIFKHVSRDFNIVAHELAQLARSEESTCLWNGVPPPAVSMFVHSDSWYLA